MSRLSQELVEISEVLQTFVSRATNPEVTSSLDALLNSASRLERAWSGSWIGYQANVYYKDFQAPPPDVHYNSIWGSGKEDGWIQFDYEDVVTEIMSKTKPASIELAHELASEGQLLFMDKRDEVLSILEVSKEQRDDTFLDELQKSTKLLNVLSTEDYIAGFRPNQVLTAALTDLARGIVTPPHITVAAEVAYIRSRIEINRKLAAIAQKGASHLERVILKSVSVQPSGARVFIGHGSSRVWKDLKDFIQDRLKLDWDEFNRVPVAGRTNTSRLSEMLNSASIAFLIMTAEDEQPNGNVRARMNVIHEAGLFQGKLGFTRAIVVLEDGCEEFSNIQGLGQIRFPKGDIKSSFEEIRMVLEREGLLSK
jgi:predicted nucleotide-binding protein